MGPRNIITLTGELSLGQMSARLKALKSAIEPTRNELTRLKTEIDTINAIAEKDRTKEQSSQLKKMEAEYKNLTAVLKDLEAETTNNVRAMSALAKVQLKGFAASTGNELKRAIKEAEAKLRNFTGKQMSMEVSILGVDGVRQKVTVLREDLEKFIRVANTELKVRMGGMGDALKESQAMRAELEKLTPIQREQRAAEQAKHQETLRAYNEERNVYIENIEMYRQEEKRFFEEKKGYESTIAELRAKDVTKVTTYKESDVTKQEEAILAKVRLREAAERKVAEAKQKATDAGITEQMMENGVVSAAEKQAQVQQQVNEQLQKTVELTKEQKAAMKQQANDTIKQVHGAAMSTTDYVGDKTKFFQYQQKMAGADVWERLNKMQRLGTKFADPLGFSYNPFSVSELEKQIELLKQMDTEEKKVVQDASKAGASPLQGLHQFVAGLQGEFKTLIESAKKAGVDIKDFVLDRVAKDANTTAGQIAAAMKDGKVLSDPLMQQANDTFAKLKQMLVDWKASIANGKGISVNDMSDLHKLLGTSDYVGLRNIIHQATPGTAAPAAPVTQKPFELPYYMTADYEKYYQRQMIKQLSEQKGIRLRSDTDKIPAAIRKDVEAAMEQFRQMRDNPEVRQKFIEVYQNAITTMKADMDAIRGAADQAMQEAQKLGANSSVQYKEKLTRSVAPLKGKLGISESNGGKLPWDDPEKEKKVVQALNMRNRAEGLATISMEQATNAGKQEAQQIAALTQQNEQEAKSTMTRAEALAKLQEAWMKLNGSRTFSEAQTSSYKIGEEGAQMSIGQTTTKQMTAQEWFDKTYRSSGTGNNVGLSALRNDSVELNTRIKTAEQQLAMLEKLSAQGAKAIKPDGPLLKSDFEATITNALEGVSKSTKWKNAARKVGENIDSLISSSIFKAGGTGSADITTRIHDWITNVRQKIDSIVYSTKLGKTQMIEQELLPMLNLEKSGLSNLAKQYDTSVLTEEQLRKPTEAAAKLREALEGDRAMLELVEQAQRSWNNTTAQTTQATEQEATAVATNAQATQQRTQATKQQTQATEKQIQAQQHANQQNQLTHEIAQGVIADMVNQGQIEHQLADDKRVVTNITQEEVNAKKQLIATAEGELEAAKLAEQAERDKLTTIQASIGNAEKLVEAEENQVAAEKDLQEATKNREEEEKRLHEFEEQRKADVQAAEKYMKKYGQSLVMSEGDIKRYISALQTARTEKGVTPAQYKEYGKDISFWKEMLGELTKNINTSMKNLGNVSDPVLKTLKQHFTDIVNDVDASDAAVKRATKSLEKINKEDHKRSIKSITSTGIDGLDVGAIQKRIQEAQQLQKNDLTTKKEWKDLQTVIDAGTKSLEKFNAEQAKSQSRKDLRLLSSSKIGTLSEQEISDAVKRLQQYAQQAHRTVEEREKLNKAIERGTTVLQKTQNGDNLARMTEQYNYLTKSQQNLATMTDDAMLKQSRFWLQQSTLVKKGSAEEAEYLARYRKTTEAMEERQRRQTTATLTRQLNGKDRVGLLNGSVKGTEAEIRAAILLTQEMNKGLDVTGKKYATNLDLINQGTRAINKQKQAIDDKNRTLEQERRRQMELAEMRSSLKGRSAESVIRNGGTETQLKNAVALLSEESKQLEMLDPRYKKNCELIYQGNRALTEQNRILQEQQREQDNIARKQKEIAELRSSLNGRSAQDVIRNGGTAEQMRAAVKLLEEENEKLNLQAPKYKENTELIYQGNQQLTEQNRLLQEQKRIDDEKARAKQRVLDLQNTLNGQSAVEILRNGGTVAQIKTAIELLKMENEQLTTQSPIYAMNCELIYKGTRALEEQNKKLQEQTREAEKLEQANAIRNKVYNTETLRLQKQQEIEVEERKIGQLESEIDQKRIAASQRVEAIDREREQRQRDFQGNLEKEKKLTQELDALKKESVAAEKARAEVMAKYGTTGFALTPEILAKENQIYAENGAKIREILAQREQSQKRVQELTAQQTLLDKDEEQTLLRIERLNEQIVNTKNKAERGRLVAQRDNLQNELPALSARRQLIDEEIQKQQQLDREYQKSHETLRNINGYLREYKIAQEGVRAAAEAVAAKEREIQDIRNRRPTEMTEVEYKNRVAAAERELNLAKQNAEAQRTLVEQMRADLQNNVGIELKEEEIRANLLGLQREEFEVLKKAETEKLLAMDRKTTEKATYEAQLSIVKDLMTVEQERAMVQKQLNADIQRDLLFEEAEKVATTDLKILDEQRLASYRNLYQQKLYANAENEHAKERLLEILKIEQQRAEMNKNLKAQSSGTVGMSLDEAKGILANPMAQSAEKVQEAMKVANEELSRMQRGTEAERQEALKLSSAIEQCKNEQQKFNEESKRMTMQTQLGDYTKLYELSRSALDAQEKYWEAQKNGARTASAEFVQAEEHLVKIREAQANDARQRIGLTANPSGGLMINADGLVDQIMKGSLKSVSALKQAKAEVELFKEKFADPKDAEAMEVLNTAIAKATYQLKIAEEGVYSEETAMQRLAEVSNGAMKLTETEAGKLANAFKVAGEYYKKIGNDEGAQRMKVQMTQLEQQAENAGVAIKSVSTAASKLKPSAQQVAEAMANPEAEKNMRVLTAALKKAQEEMLKLKKGTDEYNAAGAKVARIARHMDSVARSMRDAQSGLQKFIQGVKSYAMFYFGTMQIMFRMQAMIGSVKKISDEMVNVQKVTSMTTDEVRGLSRAINAMDTRTAQEHLMAMAVEAGKLGIYAKAGAQGVEEFVRAADKITSTLGEDIGGAKAVADLVKVNDLINKGSGMGVEESLNRIGSAILAVGNNSAASYGDVVSFVKQVGAVGSISGMTMAQLTALAGTYSSLGARIDQSATSINKMMVGMQKNAEKVAQVTGQSAIALRQMVSEGDTFGALLSVLDQVNAMGGNVANQVSAILDAFGGRKNAQMTTALTLLIGNTKRLREELGYATEAYESGTLMMDEYIKVQNNLSGVAARLGNELKETFVNEGAEESLKSMFNVIVFLVKGLIGLINFFKKLGEVTNGWFKWAALFVMMTWKMVAASKALAVTLNTNAWAAFGNAIKSNIAYLGLWIKSLFQAGAAAAVTKEKMEALKAAGATNWITLLVVALASLAGWLYRVWEASQKVSKAMDQMDSEIATQQGNVDFLINSYQRSLKPLKEASDEQEKMRNVYEKQAKTFEKLTDEEKKNTDAQQKLAKAKADSEEADQKLNKAEAETNRLLSEINTKYADYLGFQLKDIDNANLVAAAHERISATLEKEAKARMMNQLKEDIIKDKAEDIATQQNDISRWIKTSGNFDDRQAVQATRIITGDVQAAIREAMSNAVKDGTSLENETNASDIRKSIVERIVKDVFRGKERNSHDSLNVTQLISTNIEEYAQAIIDYYVELEKVEEAFGDRNDEYAKHEKEALIGMVEETTNSFNLMVASGKAGIKEFVGGVNEASTETRKQLESSQLAMVTHSEKFKNATDDEKRAIITLSHVTSDELKQMTVEQRSRAIEYLQAYIKNAGELLKTSSDNVKEVLRTNMMEYQSYIRQMQQENQYVLQTRIWGEGGKDFQSMSVKQLNQMYSNIKNALNALANPSSNSDDPYALSTEIASMILSKEQGGMVIMDGVEKRLSDQLSQTTGQQELHQLLDAASEQLEAEAKRRHITLNGKEASWNHPSSHDKDKWKQEAKDQYNAYIKELDDYYVRQQMAIDRARAKGLINLAEYNKRIEALEREHEDNRSKLRNQYMEGYRNGKLFDEEIGKLSDQDILDIYGKQRKVNKKGEYTESESEFVARFKKEFDKNKKLIQKLGDAFLDEIKLKSDEDQLKILQTWRKHQDEFEKAVIEGNPLAKVKKDFQDKLNDLKLIFGKVDFEQALLGNVEHTTEEYEHRMTLLEGFVARISTMTEEEFTAQLKMTDEFKTLEEDEMKLLYQNLLKYRDDYDEAARKKAKNDLKLLTNRVESGEYYAQQMTILEKYKAELEDAGKVGTDAYESVARAIEVVSKKQNKLVDGKMTTYQQRMKTMLESANRRVKMEEGVKNTGVNNGVQLGQAKLRAANADFAMAIEEYQIRKSEVDRRTIELLDEIEKVRIAYESAEAGTADAEAKYIELMSKNKELKELEVGNAEIIADTYDKMLEKQKAVAESEAEIMSERINNVKEFQDEFKESISKFSLAKLESIDAKAFELAKLRAEKELGLVNDTQRQRFLIIKKSGEYEQRWLNQEEAIILQRQIDAANQRREAMTESLHKFGENISKTLQDAWRRQYELKEEKKKEEERQAVIREAQNDSLRMQLGAEQNFTSLLQSELDARLEYYRNYYQSLEAMAGRHNAPTVNDESQSAVAKTDSSANIAVVNADKLQKFSEGGFIRGAVKERNGDGVLVRVNAGEAVLTTEQQRAFMALANGKVDISDRSVVKMMNDLKVDMMDMMEYIKDYKAGYMQMTTLMPEMTVSGKKTGLSSLDGYAEFFIGDEYKEFEKNRTRTHSPNKADKQKLYEYRKRLYYALFPGNYDVDAAVKAVQAAATPIDKGFRKSEDGMNEAAWALYMGVKPEDAYVDWTKKFAPADYTITKGKPVGKVYKITTNEWQSRLDNKRLLEILAAKDDIQQADEWYHGFLDMYHDYDTFLGNFTRGRGSDAQGNYIFYYDEWDLNPFKGLNKDYSFKKWLVETMSGEDISNIGYLSQGIGTPFSLYDRRYYLPSDVMRALNDKWNANVLSKGDRERLFQKYSVLAEQEEKRRDAEWFERRSLDGLAELDRMMKKGKYIQYEGWANTEAEQRAYYEEQLEIARKNLAELPKFHTGGSPALGTDEVPVVIRTQEMVITPEQQKQLLDIANGVGVNVQNNDFTELADALQVTASALIELANTEKSTALAIAKEMKNSAAKLYSQANNDKPAVDTIAQQKRLSGLNNSKIAPYGKNKIELDISADMKSLLMKVDYDNQNKTIEHGEDVDKLLDYFGITIESLRDIVDMFRANNIEYSFIPTTMKQVDILPKPEPEPKPESKPAPEPDRRIKGNTLAAPVKSSEEITAVIDDKSWGKMFEAAWMNIDFGSDVYKAISMSTKQGAFGPITDPEAWKGIGISMGMNMATAASSVLVKKLGEILMSGKERTAKIGVDATKGERKASVKLVRQGFDEQVSKAQAERDKTHDAVRRAKQVYGEGSEEWKAAKDKDTKAMVNKTYAEEYQKQYAKAYKGLVDEANTAAKQMRKALKAAGGDTSNANYQEARTRYVEKATAKVNETSVRTKVYDSLGKEFEGKRYTDGKEIMSQSTVQHMKNIENETEFGANHWKDVLGISDADTAPLEEARKQTDLLQQIANNTNPAGKTSSQTGNENVTKTDAATQPGTSVPNQTNENSPLGPGEQKYGYDWSAAEPAQNSVANLEANANAWAQASITPQVDEVAAKEFQTKTEEAAAKYVAAWNAAFAQTGQDYIEKVNAAIDADIILTEEQKTRTKEVTATKIAEDKKQQKAGEAKEKGLQVASMATAAVSSGVQDMVTQASGNAMLGQIAGTLAQVGGNVIAGIASGSAKTVSEMGWWGLAFVPLIQTALMALLGLATSKMKKAQAEVSQATGVSSGKLTTGMLTYATGRYLEDGELEKGRISAGMLTMADGYQPGQSYSVDGADGNNYDAKFEGEIDKTGIRKGTHFGIFSEVKPEMVIDGDTTALMHNKYPMLENAIMQLHRTGSLNMGEMLGLNYAGISKTITTLQRHGSLGGFRMPTFADGRYPEMSGIDGMNGMDGVDGMDGINGVNASSQQSQMIQLNATLALLQQTLEGGIGATVDSSQASRQLAKQKRFEKRNGIKNGLNG